MCQCDTCLNSDDECSEDGEEVEIHHICESCLKDSEERHLKDELEFRQRLLALLMPVEVTEEKVDRLSNSSAPVLFKRYGKLAAMIRKAKAALRLDIKRLQGG